MKKSTIVLALLVCAFVFQGAFADVVTLSDITGDYETDGATISTPDEDYANGIYTTYNDGTRCLSSDIYKGFENFVPVSANHVDLDGYFIQSLCASGTGVFAEESCDIPRTNLNNNYSDYEIYIWCRLKRISDNVSSNSWVYYGFNPAGEDAVNCARFSQYSCVGESHDNPAFRSALLAPFEQ
ncbi:MAG: hypothetical protein LBJ73_02395 [Rickettsiales bacterium]|jgi:hypothetical protein|nr:hypothetical protein [Rickettsiales bacterium]